MQCCIYWLQGVFQSPEEALKEYAARRTVDGKAVTIPSQRRYLWYFHSQIVSLGHLRAPRPETLRLQRLSLRGLPAELTDRLCVVIWTREDGPPLRPSPLALLVAHDSRVRISSRFAGLLYSSPDVMLCLAGSNSCQPILIS